MWFWGCYDFDRTLNFKNEIFVPSNRQKNNSRNQIFSKYVDDNAKFTIFGFKGLKIYDDYEFYMNLYPSVNYKLEEKESLLWLKS